MQLLQATIDGQRGVQGDRFRVYSDAVCPALAIENAQPRNTRLADFALIVVEDLKLRCQMALARSFQERP